MTKKQKILIGLAVIIFILGLLLLLLAPKEEEEALVAEEPIIEEVAPPVLEEPEEAEEEEEVEGEEVPPPPLTEEERTSANLTLLASSFAERFGSFSNQSDFENIENLKTFITAKMASWADKYLKEKRAEERDTSIYFGVTTKAISSEVLSQNEDKAEIMVSCQRREATGTTANARVYYQDIKIELIKEAGVWKVNEAYWQ